MANEYDLIDCPLCEADLSVVYETAVALYRSHLDGGSVAPRSSEGSSQSWQVRCYNGHVLLLPGDLGCPQGCDDECEHGEFDHQEEWREFRDHDVARLREVLDKFAVTTS